MKPVHTKIPETLYSDVFAVRMTDQPCFSTEFHFHKECQLSYILESEGKRIIGDSVESFGHDELIFVGSDLPHVWYSEVQYDGKTEAVHARSLSLFFDPERVVDMLSHYGSDKKLSSFLRIARRGMIFSGATKETLKTLLYALYAREGLPRLIVLLRILDVLGRTNEYLLLASDGYSHAYQRYDNERIDRVFRYVLGNFTSSISLDEVARMANMNKQAFCRFFKSRTKKTFMQFVNDIRIGHACKLMGHEDCSISALAYECGFNSLSNFNKLFRQAKGMTPREFKKMLLSE